MENYKLYNDEYYEHCNKTRNSVTVYEKLSKYFPEKTKTILDLGCGDGKGLLSLDGELEKLVGVDFSRVAINLAELNKERTMLRSDVYFYYSDFVSKIETYGKFDVILMIDSIEHIEKERVSLIVEKLKNHLTETGIVIIHTPIYKNEQEILNRIKKAKEEKDKNRHEFWIFNVHINLQTEDSIRELFANYNVRFPEKDTILVRRK